VKRYVLCLEECLVSVRRYFLIDSSRVTIVRLVDHPLTAMQNFGAQLASVLSNDVSLVRSWLWKTSLDAAQTASTRASVVGHVEHR